MSTLLLNPYCTVQQLRDYIRNTDASITSQLETSINAASRFIDRYKGRDFFEHDFTSETPLVINRWSKAIFADNARPGFYDHGLNPGKSRHLLQLKWRVLEITSLTVAGIAWIQDTDFEVDADEGLLISLRENWPERTKTTEAIVIEGRFGYDQGGHTTLDSTAVPTGMPAEISQAAVQIAAALSRQNFKDVVGLDGQKTSLLDITIPKSAMILLGSPALLT